MMRLPIAMGVGLLVFLSMGVPVMSQSPTPEIQPSVNVARSSIRQYRTNHRLWNRQNITNYRYTLNRGCFCLPEARGPVVVEVRNGKTVSVKFATTGKPVNPEFFQKYDTTPKLFDLVKDAIAKKVSRLDVEYDRQLGYPTKINIDYNSQIADEEEYITVENLQVIR